MLGELTPKHFSFNSYVGACPACHGLGTFVEVQKGAFIRKRCKISSPRAVHGEIFRAWSRRYGPRYLREVNCRLGGQLCQGECRKFAI
jgi:excinuclease ABC subunit A